MAGEIGDMTVADAMLAVPPHKRLIGDARRVEIVPGPGGDRRAARRIGDAAIVGEADVSADRIGRLTP